MRNASIGIEVVLQLVELAGLDSQESEKYSGLCHQSGMFVCVHLVTFNT